MTHLRREGADAPAQGRPWKLSLEDRVLLVAACWRTNSTMRRLAPLFGVSKSAADRVIDDIAAARQSQRLPGRAWAESDAKAAVGSTMTIADGGTQEPGL